MAGMTKSVNIPVNSGHGRDDEEREYPGEQQPDHHHVGPAEPVAEPGAQRADSTVTPRL